MPEIQLIIKNAVKWSAPTGGPDIKIGHFPEPLEKIAK
jgi:hypothetical protein